MMLSSIVYGFSSYKAYDNKAYDNKAYKAYDNKAKYAYDKSLRQQSLQQAWIRLEVTWENLLCVLPPSSTDFCYSESEYWFHANHPTIVIDQTIANRVVQSSYLRWHNFQQPANFLVCTLVDNFISIICGGTTILLHYSDGHCCYSRHTIERIEMKSLLSLSFREFGVCVCVGYALIFLSYPHTLSVYLPLRENAIASLVAVLW